MGKKMKGDLDKDGKMSSYETARSNAIQKAMGERKTAKKGGRVKKMGGGMMKENPMAKKSMYKRGGRVR
jgi:hypothetical protein